MKCDKFQAFLPEIILGAPGLRAEARASLPADVRQHLSECAHCQKELRELQATMQLLVDSTDMSDWRRTP